MHYRSNNCSKNKKIEEWATAQIWEEVGENKIKQLSGKNINISMYAHMQIHKSSRQSFSGFIKLTTIKGFQMNFQEISSNEIKFKNIEGFRRFCFICDHGLTNEC